MKATLDPRKKVRLQWFSGSVKFTINRLVQITYNLRSVVKDVLLHKVWHHYLFDGETISQREIPASDVILLTGGLPFLWTKTGGSVAEKLATADLIDPTFKVEDRIITVERGEETVSVKDSPHPDRQIETRERNDLYVRRISIKNELGKETEITLKVFETGNIDFLEANPEPGTQDRPLHEWKLTIPKDTEQNVQIKLKVHVTDTREIKKPKIDEALND